MGKKFGSPAQFRGDMEGIKAALVSNWRALITHLNAWLPSYDDDGSTLTLPGDLAVGGDLTVTGSIPTIDHGSGLSGLGDDDHTQYALDLIAIGTYSDTTDYTNVPAAATITHSTSVAVGAAAEKVYVDVSINVRWKGGTAGGYVYSRPTVNGASGGLICITELDAASVIHETQSSRSCGSYVADGSGNIVLGTQCFSQGADADVEEVTISYTIWGRR